MTRDKLTNWLDSAPLPGISAWATRAELCRMLGVHRNTLRRWEAGTTPMPAMLAYALTALYYRLPLVG